MAWAVWIDEREATVWAQGTHEYRPAGVAVIARTDQFRLSDFDPARPVPRHLHRSFSGFFASLEEVNRSLRSGRRSARRGTPAYVR